MSHRRKDAYLAHLRSGMKPDTLAAIRTVPLHMAILFPKRAEEDIAQYENKRYSGSSSHKKEAVSPLQEVR